MTNSIKVNRKTIQPGNSKQATYLSSINTHDILFAVGSAVSKTYLAISKAKDGK